MMSDCFSRGLACSSVHTCSRNGCQRKATGFDPVDHQARDKTIADSNLALYQRLREDIIKELGESFDLDAIDVALAKRIFKA